MTEFVRAGCPEVEPLEVWELEFDGRPVWEILGSEAVARRREAGEDPRSIGHCAAETALDLSRRLQRGGYGRECFSSRQQRTAASVEGCATVCFTGGLTRLAGFESALTEARAEVLLLTDDRDVLTGGRCVLAGQDRSGAVALVADVGQTAIKTGVVSADGVVSEVRRFARPWNRLPVWMPSGGYRRAPAATDSGPQQPIDRVVDFVADAISRTLQACDAPVSALVLALPCELGPELEPAACSYGDWAAAPRLVHRIVEAAAFPAPSGLVVGLNDAELAGYAVLDKLEAAGRRDDALVLTLGFGPGGAYVNAGAADE
jgi:hypothetical protein